MIKRECFFSLFLRRRVNMNANTYRFIFYLMFVTCNIYSKAVKDLAEELQVAKESPLIEIFTQKQVITHNCSESEEFVTCKSCERTCDGQNTSCSENCGTGCFCNLFRDKDGKCVSYENCSLHRKNVNASLPPFEIFCGPHQEFNSCRACERSCSNLNPTCDGPCSSGCFCVDGYVLAPNGQCIESHNCPKEEFLSKDVFFGHEVSIEECASDEVFVQCGWCEGSCSDPAPRCGPACTRGCVCLPPLLRHHSGHCVLEEDCKPQKCQNINEEYVCKYGCEARCVTQTCDRPRRCRLGCHCQLGLLRDVDGNCVKPEQCSNNKLNNI